MNNSVSITTQLVKELITEQFPAWAHLEITPVTLSGIDNRTFRLGKKLLVRLPSAEKYAAQVPKEQTWLPLLAPELSVAIPEPVAIGQPSKNYPWQWSIYTWIEGYSANSVQLDERTRNNLARELALFLQALHKIDITDGPLPGSHNFWRGGRLSTYDKETKAALQKLHTSIDVNLATAVWEQALSSVGDKKSVWVHGDLSRGNILLKEGQLVGIIDFGCMAVGDPACDLVPAWTIFASKSRKIFMSHVGLDTNTWYRARGWALWKALITLVSYKDTESEKALRQKELIHEIIFKDE